MATFILADKQELTSFAFEHLIERFGENEVYHAYDKGGLMQILREHECSVVVLDYTLFDFFDASNFLVLGQRFPLAQWLLVSDDFTDQFLRSVIYQSHNVSIVFKDSPLKEILEALSYTIRGDRYICQHVTEIILSQQQREQEIPSKLTPTEIEITRAIAQGKTTKEIAAERFLSIHTINTHRKNIFRKLNVNTAHEAIKVAVRSGLIDESEYYI